MKRLIFLYVFIYIYALLTKGKRTVLHSSLCSKRMGEGEGIHTYIFIGRKSCADSRDLLSAQSTIDNLQRLDCRVRLERVRERRDLLLREGDVDRHERLEVRVETQRRDQRADVVRVEGLLEFAKVERLDVLRGVGVFHVPADLVAGRVAVKIAYCGVAVHKSSQG